jgi:hypothetical protein
VYYFAASFLPRVFSTTLGPVCEYFLDSTICDKIRGIHQHDVLFFGCWVEKIARHGADLYNRLLAIAGGVKRISRESGCGFLIKDIEDGIQSCCSEPLTHTFARRRDSHGAVVGLDQLID